MDLFRFSNWYPAYSHLTPPAILIKNLSEEFIEFLLFDDGVARPTMEFPELHLDIRRAIKKLGRGAVVPKLLLSTSTESPFTHPSSLKCKTPADIYRALKISAFLDNDFIDSNSDNIFVFGESRQEESASLDPISFNLILLNDFPIAKPLLFRCFVKSRVLVGISQHDTLTHYPFLNDLEDSISYEIEEFFENHLQNAFASTHFVFDVYIPDPYDRVFLLDIMPWTHTTDPLLFKWPELFAISNVELNVKSLNSDLSNTGSLHIKPSHPIATEPVNGIHIISNDSPPNSLSSLNDPLNCKEFSVSIPTAKKYTVCSTEGTFRELSSNIEVYNYEFRLVGNSAIAAPASLDNNKIT